MRQNDPLTRLCKYPMLKLSPFIPSRFFPPVEHCDENGLLAAGGDLSQDFLIDAYTHGIFPWPMEDSGPLLWWSPDPRAILDLEHVHFPRRLLRTCRSNRFQVTCNADFAGVIRSCATVHGSTWITPEILNAYLRLHRLGWAHSVETWHENRLVGGVYGVAIRGLFAGESMFHTMTDASKAALFFLVERLRQRDYKLFDIQMLTGHTQRFGATEISRKEYLDRLDEALTHDCSFID